jgi:hypothetical protein
MTRFSSLSLFAFLSLPIAAAEPAGSLTVGEGFSNPIGFHDSSLTYDVTSSLQQGFEQLDSQGQYA